MLTRLYPGIFIATFLTYVGLVVGEGRGRINLLMLLAAIALFLIITTVSITRIMTARPIHMAYLSVFFYRT